MGAAFVKFRMHICVMTLPERSFVLPIVVDKDGGDDRRTKPA